MPATVPELSYTRNRDLQGGEARPRAVSPEHTLTTAADVSADAGE